MERGIPSPRIHAKFLKFDASGHVVHGVSAAILHLNTKKTARVVHNNKSLPATGVIFSNFSKDANAQFISWYAFRTLNYSSSYTNSYSHYRVSAVGYNALPFHGGGTLKKMTFAGFASNPNMEFKGAILSTTPSGLPGTELASTASTTFSDTSFCCTGVRTVKFTAGEKTLPDGDYFVVVECASNPCQGGWDIEDADYTGNMVDYWFYRFKEVYTSGCGTGHYTYSTPWHESTTLPATGAVVIK